MKTVFKNIGIFFLASLVLFASTGITVSSHFCSSQKKSTVSVFENKGCCAKKKNKCSSTPSSHSQIKKNCCQISISYHKLDISSLKADVKKYFFDATSFVQTIFAETFHSAISFLSGALPKPPDLFAFGKNLLHRISILRI